MPRPEFDRAGWEANRAKPKPLRFALVPFEQLTVTSTPDYRIKGLYPRTGLYVVWGPPKCGKTFVVFDATLHIALGWAYRGRKVVQTSVVYCAFEGQGGYGKRKAAFCQQYAGRLPDKILFSLMSIRMDLIRDHQQFIAEVKQQVDGEARKKYLDRAYPNGLPQPWTAELEEGLPAAVRMPGVIVLDTLNRSLAGSESDDEDMSKYVQAADALREAFGCLVIIIHHCGVEGTRPRGHTSLTGAAEGQAAVTREGDIVTFTVEYMKDGAEGETVVSKLKAVTVGQDDDGDDITSCIIEPVGEQEAAAVSKGTNRKLNDRQRLSLDALGECVLTTGAAPPAAYGLPIAVRVVKAEAWREELLRRRVLDPGGANPRQEFKRLAQQLAARQLIGRRDDFVWKAT